MKLLGNIIWFLLGGIILGLSWWLIGIIAYISIIGIPWGKACFVIGTFSFFPFGKEVVNRKEFYKKDDIGTGFLGLLGNIIWFLFAGIWLAIAHLTAAVANFISIIGIPFGIQHIKLALISLAPIGKTVVDRKN